MTGSPLSHRILIVEDDADIREALSEVLADHGYSPVLAGNGRDALECLRALDENPCIILLDIMMPVMSGTEFRAVQRSDPRFANIPVVVLSAHANVTEAAKEMGASDALKKPIQLDALMSILHRFCHPMPTN